MSCPICTAPVENESCETCGSLEGVDANGFAASRVFGYDWAAGSVAPWRDASGQAYATPAELAEVALAAAGIERGGYIIDLGCGDAAILRAAATRYGCRGLGLDIDDGALADAARAIEADGVADLVSVRRGDLNGFDLAGEVEAHAGPVVVTCYLLPATLRELRPQLEDAVHRRAAVILFRWDCGLAWQGPVGRHDDRGFTVYKMEPDRLSPLVEVLGVEALQYVDTASLGCLNACARTFGKQSEATGRSQCEDEAYRRLRADERFRHQRNYSKVHWPGQDGKMPAPNPSRPTRGGGFPGWIYVLNDWERYWVFRDRGHFQDCWERGEMPGPDGFSYRRIEYILNLTLPLVSTWKLYTQFPPDPDKVAWSRDYEGYTGPSDRLSPLVDVGLLGVNALAYVDAASLGRLSACAMAFGYTYPSAMRGGCFGPLSLCDDAAHGRLLADKRFRDVRSGQMPESVNPYVWGRDGFPGWLHVLRDWEQALNFERRGGFNAFDLSDKLEHIEEMNRGAQSFRRMKRILGHMRSTRRIRDM